MFIVCAMTDPDSQMDFNFAADDLLEFPRDLGEEGWFQFHSEQKQTIQTLERRFGVLLNKHVRVRLNGRDEEFEGRMVLDSLQIPSLCDDSIQLRIDRISFDSHEIEFLELLDASA